MHKQKRLHYAFIGVLSFALLFMAVGFVAYAHLVNNDAFAANSVNPVHNVGFDADSYQESDNSVAPTEKLISGKNFSAKIHLEKPGDNYAALINIVNKGNVEEILDEIQMSKIDPAIADSVDYRISFNDEDYIGTSYDIATAINRGQIGSRQMFIQLSYKEDAKNISPIDLDISAKLIFE